MLETFQAATHLAARAFFFWENFFRNSGVFICDEKRNFAKKHSSYKNESFSMLEHHLEHAHTKLVLLTFLMLRREWTMLGLWAVLFLTCISLFFKPLADLSFRNLQIWGSEFFPDWTSTITLFFAKTWNLQLCALVSLSPTIKFCKNWKKNENMCYFPPSFFQICAFVSLSPPINFCKIPEFCPYF